jgi:hypothetical protein
MDRIRRFDRLIERFDLVSFRKVADWLAHAPMKGVERSETRRTRAYRDLAGSVLAGEFGAGRWPFVVRMPEFPERSHDPGRFPLRVSLVQVEYAYAMLDGRDGAIIEIGIDGGDIGDYWAPRALVDKWFVARRSFVDPPPWLARATATIEHSPARQTTVPPRSGIKTTREAAAEEAARQWLHGRGGGDRPTKDAAFKDAKIAVESIGPLTLTAFGRVWHDEAPAAWKRQGRPKKRK